MKPTIPLQFTQAWATVSVLVELAIIIAVLVYGLKPPHIFISTGIVLCGILTGVLCTKWFVRHVIARLGKSVPESKELCASIAPVSSPSSETAALLISIIVIMFIIVWSSFFQTYEKVGDRIYSPAWFLTYLCSQSLWFDFAKFRFLWGRKGVLRTLTAPDAK